MVYRLDSVFGKICGMGEGATVRSNRQVRSRKWLRTVLFLLAVLIAACSASVPEEIIGYWEGITLKQDMRFSADGRVEIVDHKFSTYTGTYRISEDNILTCRIDHRIFTAPVVRSVKIKGDRLILTENNREEIYRRRR